MLNITKDCYSIFLKYYRDRFEEVEKGLVEVKEKCEVLTKLKKNFAHSMWVVDNVEWICENEIEAKYIAGEVLSRILVLGNDDNIKILNDSGKYIALSTEELLDRKVFWCDYGYSKDDTCKMIVDDVVAAIKKCDIIDMIENLKNEPKKVVYKYLIYCPDCGSESKRQNKTKMIKDIEAGRTKEYYYVKCHEKDESKGYILVRNLR